MLIYRKSMAQAVISTQTQKKHVSSVFGIRNAYKVPLDSEWGKIIAIFSVSSLSLKNHFTKPWFRKCLNIQFHPALGNNKNLICSSDSALESTRELRRNPAVTLSTPVAQRVLKLWIPRIWPEVAFYRKTNNMSCTILSNRSKNGFWPHFLLGYRNLT